MAHVRIFLSAVSSEFRSYRDRLAAKLKRPNLSVYVQEDFIAAGTETLDKLDDYIRECEAVVHLVGDMTGAMASPSAVAAITGRYPDLAARFPPLAETLSTGAPALSYTQWEAFLALYHRKILIIATPVDGARRDPTYRKVDAETASQQAHLQRLKSCDRYPEINFANADDLIIEVLRSKFPEILRTVDRSIIQRIPYGVNVSFAGYSILFSILSFDFIKFNLNTRSLCAGLPLVFLSFVCSCVLAIKRLYWDCDTGYLSVMTINVKTPFGSILGVGIYSIIVIVVCMVVLHADNYLYTKSTICTINEFE
jgi:hypothetical protein